MIKIIHCQNVILFGTIIEVGGFNPFLVKEERVVRKITCYPLVVPESTYTIVIWHEDRSKMEFETRNFGYMEVEE